MKRSFQVVLLIGVATLGAALYVLRGGLALGEPRGALGPTVESAARGLSVPTATRREAGEQGQRDLPRIILPSLDVPLAPEMPALLDAVRRGDVGAMCRLAYELHRCGPTLESRRAMEAIWTESLLEPERAKGPGETSNDSLMQMLAKTSAEREQLERICRGVKQQPGLEPWRLLRNAARAGHVPSMVRFATSFPMDNKHFLADLDGLTAYRDEAPGFLKRAVEMGDPRAAYYLMWTYMGNGMLSNTGKFPDDPERALAYAIALRDTADEKTQKILAAQELRLRRKLSTAQQREAERTATRISPRFAASRGARLDLEASKFRNSPEACN